MREIYTGIYSYPKSGNTWMRAIVAAGYGMPDTPETLLQLLPGTARENRDLVPFQCGGDSLYFYKSHWQDGLDSYRGKPLRTDRYLYIYRNPLDVFMSYLNFLSGNVTGRGQERLQLSFESVDGLSPQQFEMLFSRFVGSATLVPQNRKYGSVFSSFDAFAARREAGDAVHMVKYEDLKADFEKEAAKIFDFLEHDPGKIRRVFKQAEKYTQKDGKFFWKRKKNNYRDYLSREQIERFKFVYAEELERMGYPDL